MRSAIESRQVDGHSVVSSLSSSAEIEEEILLVLEYSLAFNLVQADTHILKPLHFLN